jgi:hypothetical protein
MRLPALPESIVRDTSDGRALAARELLNASRGGAFSTFHSPELVSAALDTAPVEMGNTPCARFVEVFPGTSSGCDGTMPIGPVFK